MVVPGNSIYRYVVNIPDTPANQITDYPTGGRFTVTASDGAVATKVFDGHYYDPTNNNAYTDFFVDVQFTNKPGNVTIKLPKANWVKGYTGAEAVTLTVHVVQVLVTDPLRPRKAFVPSQALKNGTQKGWVAGQVTFTEPTLVPDQDVAVLQILSKPKDAQEALTWQAQVTLNGPDGNKYLDRIQVGFHQTVDRTAQQSLDATTFINDNREGKTFLDSDLNDSWPWYSGNFPGNKALIDGDANGGMPTTIKAWDSPSFNMIVQYGAGHFDATSVAVNFTADLSVAAGTKDDGGLGVGGYQPSARVFQEAYAPWSVNANGTIQVTGSGENASATWTPDPNNQTEGVTAPQGWVVIVAPPTNLKGLLTTGMISNDAAKPQNLTFAHYARS